MRVSLKSADLSTSRAGRARSVKTSGAVWNIRTAGVGRALRYAAGSAPARRPTPTRVPFLNGRTDDISIWWTHTQNCDQVLIVTSGSGMVPNEREQREIKVGDVVHIKAGERHWHGAKTDTTMGHITITLVGSQATRG